ncbi:MAG: non-canonical purine NTP pyrophosphatase, partial [Candidatus Aenigmarchaeota archaeon]|nr:non-canonical purine NTP pyrophosphatase [Candidatus Aenigmarchaeota archaeon]
MVKEIIFITGNEKKYLIAKKYFENTGIKLIRKNFDCPEIQDMDVVEVAKFSAKFMSEKLNKPIIKSDNGFYIEALNGFPGTYMRDVQDAIGKEGFKKLMVGE